MTLTHFVSNFETKLRLLIPNCPQSYAITSKLCLAVASKITMTEQLLPSP